MKQYACLNSQWVVIAVEFLDVHSGDYIENAEAYIQVGEGGINPIPSIGQVWDGINLQFV